MSDPYGNNGGQSPYGQSNPYGGGASSGDYPPPPTGGGAGSGGYGGGYGGSFPSGGFQPAPSTDGVSIAALVLSFLCCLAPIGVILGFVGLSRTKNGQRKGRGMAIAALPIGILMTLAVAGGTTALVIFGKSIITPDDAKVGQCVNVSESDDDNIMLREKDCDDEHDGEIVAVVEVTDENRKGIEAGMILACRDAISKEDLAKLEEGGYINDVKGVIEDPKDVNVGDKLACYVDTGKKMDEPIL